MNESSRTHRTIAAWRCAAFGALMTFFGSMSGAGAEVPKRLHYQGYLTNAVGEAIDCPDLLSCVQSYTIVFRLYDDENASGAMWEETHAAVPIVDGVFHVLLGAQITLEASDLSGPRWLGLEINDGDEMLPRQELVSAAYAIYAEQAETATNATQLGGTAAADYPLKSDLSAAGTLNATDNPVDWTQLKGIPSELADGDDDDTLGGMTCATSGDVARWSSGGWTCGPVDPSVALTTKSAVPRWDGEQLVDSDLRVDEAGTVAAMGPAMGVGTDSPKAKLHVNGAMIIGNGGPGTVTRNIAQVFTSKSSTTDYWHLELPAEFDKDNGKSRMFHIHVQGYSYATSEVIDLIFVGYKTTPGNSGPLSHLSTKDLAGTCESALIYHGSDNHLYLRFRTGNTYYTSFAVHSMYVGNGFVMEAGEIVIHRDAAAKL